MPLPRRTALLLPLLARPAAAQPAFPNRPLRLVIPFPPGGGMLDALGRILAPSLAALLRQPVVVENRSGAGGSLAVDAVAKAEPDGHTLLLTGLSVAIFTPALFAALPYTAAALASLGQCGRTALGLFVPANGAADLPALLAAARRAPGALNYGSAGNGTPSHVAMELLERAAGVELTHVPYRGSPALVPELLVGRIDAVLDSPPAWLGHVRDGRLRLLAVSSAERWTAAPAVPTFAESGLSGVTAYNWSAMQVAAATPAAIRGRLAGALRTTLADPAVAGRMRDLGLEPSSSTPAELDALLASEAARWGEVIRAARIRLD